jgi:phosphoribosyl 1,2-cyclic phosphodiesterase
LSHSENQPSAGSVRIINLGSGSSGNSSLICHDGKILIVDCGFSRKQTLLKMGALGLNPVDVCGILVTHEHGDHIKGARLCSQTWDVPLMATGGTLSGGGLSHLNCETLQYGAMSSHEGFGITTVKVSHDTKEPCAFLVEAGGVRSLFITDIGTTEAFDTTQLTGIDYLYIEANHDETMLRTGPYPAFLKNRIAGPGGHLNNRESGLLVRSLAGQSPNLKSVLLAHLSHENNDPEIALRTVQEYAGAMPGVRWGVARQHESMEL